MPMQKERSEEHTSELQSRLHLVCRLLLEKKKNTLYPDPALCLASPAPLLLNYLSLTTEYPAISLHDPRKSSSHSLIAVLPTPKWQVVSTSTPGTSSKMLHVCA